MTASRPATGRQFEIRRGAATAKVGQLSAVLREFSVGGAHFTEVWDDAWIPPMGCGMILMPWPNRVRDGRWGYQDGRQQLDLTEVSLHNASHGLLRNTAYEVVDEQPESVTLAASIYPQHGYPFILDTSVTYALSDDGLTVTHRVDNVGPDAAPFGVGAHPYLRVGDHPVSDLTITLSARQSSRLDDQLIPIATDPVDGTANDLRAGVPMAGLDLNVALTAFDVVDGKVEHRLDAADGTALVIWGDESFGWAQVYTPSNFPGPGKPDQRQAVAIEPMTCAVDALNNGDGLLWLEPGETWSGSWGLRPIGFSV